MIVQVINSGSDVGEHQFDLQIPRSGVGIYNACSRQWGVPNDGWGQRYGSVGSRGECYVFLIRCETDAYLDLTGSEAPTIRR